MEDRDYLSTGIGVLKTLLGTYILIIVGICYAASKQTTPVAEQPVSIEAENHDNFTILSCNGRTFVIDTNTYNEFMKSSEETTDETKSEAYNHFHKKGGILAENSGYLISYLNEGRFDKLEEKIMAVVHAKIRQKIDAAKTKLKTEAFNKKFGK